MIVYSEGNTITHVGTREVGACLLAVVKRRTLGRATLSDVTREARTRRRVNGTRVTISNTVVREHLLLLHRHGYADIYFAGSTFGPTAKLDSLVNRP